MESVKETVKIRVCKGGALERVDGALEYMPLNCVKRTLILPLLSSYSCLLEAVLERLDIFANSDFMVNLHIRYQQMHGFSGNPMYVPGFPGYPMQDPQSDSANRKLKQQWYFEHRQTADEHKHELTPWAEAKLAQRIAKSATWTVRPAANYLYNVVDYYKNATVDLNTRTCSCGQWQLSGLPCGHLIAVMRHLRQSSANQFAFSCFKTSVWRASYNEVIYDVGHPSEWDQPDGLITVLPPVMDKRQPGRPRNRDHFRSKGEQITQKSCIRCFKGGHNRRDCPSVVPSQIFIPTTSSVKSGSSWNEEI
ncbi:ankyrin repeat-containing protein [Tanacetum coccineum]